MDWTLRSFNSLDPFLVADDPPMFLQSQIQVSLEEGLPQQIPVIWRDFLQLLWCRKCTGPSIHRSVPSDYQRVLDHNEIRMSLSLGTLWMDWLPSQKALARLSLSSRAGLDHVNSAAMTAWRHRIPPPCCATFWNVLWAVNSKSAFTFHFWDLLGDASL